jgi:hypothetical protein
VVSIPASCCNFLPQPERNIRQPSCKGKETGHSPLLVFFLISVLAKYHTPVKNFGQSFEFSGTKENKGTIRSNLPQQEGNKQQLFLERDKSTVFLSSFYTRTGKHHAQVKNFSSIVLNFSGTIEHRHDPIRSNLTTVTSSRTNRPIPTTRAIYKQSNKQTNKTKQALP